MVDGPALLALGDWIDRAARISKLIMDARVDERRVRVAEAQGARVVEGLRWLFGEVGLTGDQESRLRVLWPLFVRRLSGAEGPAQIESARDIP